MKEVELVAESIGRDAAAACVASAIKRHIERGGINSAPKAALVQRMEELIKQHMTRAVEGIAKRRRDLELLMSMPPINPS